MTTPLHCNEQSCAVQKPPLIAARLGSCGTHLQADECGTCAGLERCLRTQLGLHAAALWHGK